MPNFCSLADKAAFRLFIKPPAFYDLIFMPLPRFLHSSICSAEENDSSTIIGMELIFLS
jgi:hypothetical protein